MPPNPCSKYSKKICTYPNDGFNMRMVSLLVVGMLLPLSIMAGERINDKNWNGHAEIEKIRILCNKINRSIKNNELNKKIKNCVLFDGNIFVDEDLYEDKKGVVRKFVIAVGYKDSRSKAEYYYDEKGIPRFTYRNLPASDGAPIEHRIYFDSNGKHLYTSENKKESDDFISKLNKSIKDPKKYFELICEVGQY